MTLTISWEQVDFARAEDGGDLVDATTTEIVMDIVLDYEWSIGGAQSKRPIELGAPASDHWQRSLDAVTVRVGHTNTPPLSSDAIELSTIEGGKATMGRLTSGGAISRLQAIEDDLRSLIHAGHLVTVNGLSGRTLTNWRVINMSEPREVGKAGYAEFSLQFEEVIRATVSTVEAPAPRVERARPAQDDGGNNGQNAETPDQPDGEDNRSLAARLRDAAAPLRQGLFGGGRR